MSQEQIDDERDGLSDSDVKQLFQEALIEKYQRRSAEFTEEAELRCIVQNDETGLYADEHGNALSEWGERV